MGERIVKKSVEWPRRYLPAPSVRLDHTKSRTARHRNSFHSSLCVNGTANIGIASQGLGALTRQVWCPSLPQVADETPSPPSFGKTECIKPTYCKSRKGTT